MRSISTVVKELKQVCEHMDPTEYDALVSLLQKNCTFYFSGEGRSGLMAKAIAMRLMHAGKRVYVVGETTTPAIGKDDILLILSGSGQSNQTVHLGEQAYKNGAEVFLVTTNKLALDKSWCSGGLRIPAATKHRLPDEPETIQPLGNQFDQAAHIVLDAAIIDSLHSVEAQQKMIKKHSNFE